MERKTTPPFETHIGWGILGMALAFVIAFVLGGVLLEQLL